MGTILAADHKNLATGNKRLRDCQQSLGNGHAQKQRMPDGAIAPPGIRVACRETTGCVCR
jgi:hypothetical protein